MQRPFLCVCVPGQWSHLDLNMTNTLSKNNIISSFFYLVSFIWLNDSDYYFPFLVSTFREKRRQHKRLRHWWDSVRSEVSNTIMTKDRRYILIIWCTPMAVLHSSYYGDCFTIINIKYVLQTSLGFVAVMQIFSWILIRLCWRCSVTL